MFPYLVMMKWPGKERKKPLMYEVQKNWAFHQQDQPANTILIIYEAGTKEKTQQPLNSQFFFDNGENSTR
jgi:hypothetical protein